MCYAIPGKVLELRGKKAVIDYFGESKTAVNELVNLAPGDYVYAQGGYVIQKINPKEAGDILETWKDMFFELQEMDKNFSRLSFDSSLDQKLRVILDKACDEKKLKDEELLYLLSLNDSKERETFFKAANFLRQKYHSNSCCVHGIIEISNFCKRGCYYCGISSHNKNLERYRMSKAEILEAVKQAYDLGFKSLVLQSGEDSGYNIEELADIIKTIKEKYPLLIFISFGEIGEDGLKKLYTAGARGLLMRFETSNPKLYQELHPGFELANRIEEIRKAFELGYLIITGSLIGLPGQTDKDILNDIRLADELHAEMMSFGPFLAHPDSKLSGIKAPSEDKIFNVMALARIEAAKETKILVTTAFETLSKTAREKGLVSGASSLMLNVTPIKYRKLYSLYPNRAHQEESVEDQIKDAVSLLKNLGRAPTDLSVR